jgi:hypothetical protein
VRGGEERERERWGEAFSTCSKSERTKARQSCAYLDTHVGWLRSEMLSSQEKRHVGDWLRSEIFSSQEKRHVGDWLRSEIFSSQEKRHVGDWLRSEIFSSQEKRHVGVAKGRGRILFFKFGA